MERTLIILGSVTHAMRAKDILFEHGISAYVERNRRTKEFGCGYGLHVPRKAEEAEKILIAANMRVLARIAREERK